MSSAFWSVRYVPDKFLAILRGARQPLNWCLDPTCWFRNRCPVLYTNLFNDGLGVPSNYSIACIAVGVGSPLRVHLGVLRKFLPWHRCPHFLLEWEVSTLPRLSRDYSFHSNRLFLISNVRTLSLSSRNGSGAPSRSINRVWVGDSRARKQE